MSSLSASITCGAFSAIVVGYNTWSIKCSWLPEWEQTVECTQAKARSLVIGLQATSKWKNAQAPKPKLEVVK